MRCFPGRTVNFLLLLKHGAPLHKSGKVVGRGEGDEVSREECHWKLVLLALDEDSGVGDETREGEI